ncbi:MAG: ABC transporter permease, partial [Planctomycetota bacterium]
MTTYVVRRLLIGLLLLGLVAFLIFALQALSPYDASALFISPDFPPVAIEEIKRQLGLDRPWYERFVLWASQAIRFNFQLSLAQGRPVSEMILKALPNTLLLSAVSMTLIFLLGVLIGIVQAVRQFSWPDVGLTFGSLFFYSMPSFWLALMLILLVSALTGGTWPIFGMYGDEILMKESAIQTALEAGVPAPTTIGLWERMKDLGEHLLLPAVALGIPPAAGIARYTRSSMLEVIHLDYVRTARAKGLAARVVIFRHALRNALIPVITLFGLYLPFLMSGAVVVETIFAWPGMGRL